MKRLWFITAALLALALVGITAWHFWPAGEADVSALYRQYEHQPGVRVGFVEDFPFGDSDSVRVDVVTIEALDTNGWQWMEREFDFPPLDERRQQLLSQGEDVLQSWLTPADTTGHTFLFLSRQRQALCIVATADDRQLETVFIYHLKKLKNQ